MTALMRRVCAAEIALEFDIDFFVALELVSWALANIACYN